MKNLFGSWQKSLTVRITGILFILIILSVSLISYIAYLQAAGSLTQSLYERLDAVSTLKEDDLNRWVDQQRLDLVFLAWQPEVQAQAGILLGGQAPAPASQTAYDVILTYLQFVVTSVSDSDELFILDLDGNVVLSTLPSHKGQSHASDEFFAQGLTATYVQPVYISPETGRPAISVATPLFDKSKRRVGVLVGQLNLARLDRIILERTGLGASGETYLVNSTHEFVSANRIDTQLSEMKAVHSTGIDQALQGQDGKGLYRNYEGVPVVGVYNWLEDQGVVLMVEISQAEAFAPARQLAYRIGLFGFLGSLILAGVAFLLARQITRPILDITATARAVAAGDLTQQAPVETSDEVGVLARAFNQMTGQLRLLYQDLEKKVAERTAELQKANTRLTREIDARKEAQEKVNSQKEYLQALYETTLGLIGRLEIQDLFEDLVTRAGQLMGTPHGFIYILEPGENEIECKVGLGLFSNLVGYRAKRGDGLGGTVWETCQPLIVEDYDAWPGRSKVVEPGLIRNIIGVPLISRDSVVGVLGLANDWSKESNHAFGEAEVDQLSRFAALVSIALDNARLYAASKEARAAAEAANQSKSAFLANVSHELRTPLTSIVGFTHLLQKRFHEQLNPFIPPEDQKAQRAARQVDENLKIIHDESERLTDLINNLLDHEKIQAGKMTWRIAPLHIQDVIRQAASLTQTLYESKGLVWQEEIAEDLPTVMGDRNRLEQVMINLISNAVKFSDVGRITCRAGRRGDEIVVSVQDEGIGIAPADQELVFDEFKQVEQALTGKPKGTGLGLSISRQIVAHHGGRIWLESEPGQGSTFYFSLPLNIPPREPLALVGDTGTMTGGEDDGQDTGRG